MPFAEPPVPRLPAFVFGRRRCSWAGAGAQLHLQCLGELLDLSLLRKASGGYFFLLPSKGQHLPCISFKIILRFSVFDVVEYPGISF